MLDARDWADAIASQNADGPRAGLVDRRQRSRTLRPAERAKGSSGERDSWQAGRPCSRWCVVGARVGVCHLVRAPVREIVRLWRLGLQSF